ncbi:MAG: ATP synthase subunit I [Candidatus Kuenenia sp.]|nr:ATP synthase subunit I [Candidatus Kuenenia hertensis]
MINNIFTLATSFVVGMAMGILNFAGMWSTIHYLSVVKYPSVLIALSYTVRMAIILATFYFVMDGRWEKLLACMVGFFFVRRVLIKRFLPEGFKRTYHSK